MAKQDKPNTSTIVQTITDSQLLNNAAQDKSKINLFILFLSYVNFYNEVYLSTYLFQTAQLDVELDVCTYLYMLPNTEVHAQTLLLSSFNLARFSSLANQSLIIHSFFILSILIPSGGGDKYFQ